MTEVWDAEVVPLLKTDALLNAVTLLEELQRRHPGEYDSTVLRTLQRRMRQWRAVHGAERDIYFAQEHRGLRRNGTENRLKPSGYKKTLSLP